MGLPVNLLIYFSFFLFLFPSLCCPRLSLTLSHSIFLSLLSLPICSPLPNLCPKPSGRLWHLLHLYYQWPLGSQKWLQCHRPWAHVSSSWVCVCVRVCVAVLVNDSKGDLSTVGLAHHTLIFPTLPWWGCHWRHCSILPFHKLQNLYRLPSHCKSITLSLS